MSLSRRLRLGELLALAGAICLIVSLFVPWYEAPLGNLDAWDTFGPAVVLLLAACCAALAMVVSALTERSPALPVSTAVWCVPLGLIAVDRRARAGARAPRSRERRCASAHGSRSRARVADPRRRLAGAARRTPVALRAGEPEPRPRP